MDGALIVGAVAALSVLAVFRGVHLLASPSSAIAARLHAYAAAGRRREQEPEGQPLLRRLRASLDRLLAGRQFAQRVALSLAQGNLRLTVTEFLTGTLGCGLAGGVLGYALGGHVLSLAAGLLLGLALPWLLLERRRQRRIATFQAQLVDVLVLMIGSLRSGHGLLNALELASRELGPPASEEFSRVVREIGFGLSQSEALANLVRRMETDDLQLMVTAINISHEVGGNVSDVLEKIAETIRERIRLNGEVRVLTTQQRLTSYLLVALPIFLGVALSIMSPRYMMAMFRPPWIVIPVLALLLEIVGFVLAQRLTRFLPTVLSIVTEIGTDMTRWRTAKHFCSWLGLAPHNDISAGKVLRSKTLKQRNRAGQAFRMAAQSVMRSNTAFGAFFRRLAAHIGVEQAIVATAHKIARTVYAMLKNRTPFREMGADEYERRYRQHVIARLSKRASALGYRLVPQEEPMAV